MGNTVKLIIIVALVREDLVSLLPYLGRPLFMVLEVVAVVLIKLVPEVPPRL